MPQNYQSDANITVSGLPTDDTNTVRLLNAVHSTLERNVYGLQNNKSDVEKIVEVVARLRDDHNKLRQSMEKALIDYDDGLLTGKDLHQSLLSILLDFNNMGEMSSADITRKWNASLRGDK